LEIKNQKQNYIDFGEIWIFSVLISASVGFWAKNGMAMLGWRLRVKWARKKAVKIEHKLSKSEQKFEEMRAFCA